MTRAVIDVRFVDAVEQVTQGVVDNDVAVYVLQSATGLVANHGNQAVHIQFFQVAVPGFDVDACRCIGLFNIRFLFLFDAGAGPLFPVDYVSAGHFLLPGAH